MKKAKMFRILLFAFISFVVGFSTGKVLMGVILNLLTPGNITFVVTSPTLTGSMYIGFSVVYSFLIWIFLIFISEFYARLGKNILLISGLIVAFIGMTTSIFVLRFIVMHQIELMRSVGLLHHGANEYPLSKVPFLGWVPITGILIILTFGLLLLIKRSKSTKNSSIPLAAGLGKSRAE